MTLWQLEDDYLRQVSSEGRQITARKNGVENRAFLGYVNTTFFASNGYN